VIVRVADPLPECALCATPTKRDAHDRNGGLCSPCATGVADTVRMLPVRGGVVDLDSERDRRRRLEHLAGDHDDATAYVERWLPPVPGQLELTDE
jgi:hypothetical protein